MSTSSPDPHPSQPSGGADRPWRELPDRALHLASERDRHGLKRAAIAGQIERLDRGLYLVNKSNFSNHHELAAVAIRRPEAVLCLETAAAFHGITSATPGAVQFGIPRSAHAPRWQWPPIEAITLNLDPAIGGIDTHRIEGVVARITSPARTVAECLRHHERVGMERFQEILWSAWRQKKASSDEILDFAQQLGVGDAMKPYLQTVQSA